MINRYRLDVPLQPEHRRTDKRIPTNLKQSGIIVDVDSGSRTIRIELRLQPGTPTTISSSSMERIHDVTRAFLMGFDAATPPKQDDLPSLPF